MAVSPFSSLLDFHACPFPSSPSSPRASPAHTKRPPFLKRLPDHPCSRPSNVRIVAALPQPHPQESSNPFSIFHHIASQAGNVQNLVVQRLQLEDVCELAAVAFSEACRIFRISNINEYSYGLQPQFAAPNVFLSSGLPVNGNQSGSGNSSTNSSGSASLAGILAGTAPTGNKWEDKARIRRMMEERGIKKEPGVSRIEVNGKTHTFMANDRNHPQLREIRAELERVINLMKEAGYEHDLRFVLHDISDEAKERALNNHSEKLAICYGFLMTPPKSALRIVKNLRVCGDCHTATKFMSKISHREIIVRDAFRFHHFKNGVCSCGDYW